MNDSFLLNFVLIFSLSFNIPLSINLGDILLYFVNIELGFKKGLIGAFFSFFLILKRFLILFEMCLLLMFHLGNLLFYNNQNNRKYFSCFFKNISLYKI